MSFGEIVPQVFYDVIARLVAGLTIIGTCAAIWWPEIQGSRTAVAAGLEDASIVTALAFSIGAYVLALLLEGLGPFVVDWPLKRLEELWKKKKESEGGKIWAQSKKDFENTFGGKIDLRKPSEAIAMDFIRLKDTDVGARIVKLRAEASLCRSLVVGWLAVAVACFIFAAFLKDTPAQAVNPNANSMVNPWIVLPTLAMACIAIYLRRQRLRERCLTAMFNHWLLLVDSRDMSRYSAEEKGP